MDAAKRLLKDKDALTEQERVQLVKLVWLLGQLPATPRACGIDRLEAILSTARPGSPAFLDRLTELTANTDRLFNLLEEYCDTAAA